MKRNMSVKTVDHYLAQVPADKRDVLKKLRAIIRATAPDAVESISYMIPAYAQDGPVVYFAAQANFCSLYIVNKALPAKFKRELAQFEISGTSIHFTPEHPLPAPLVKRIVKERLRENEERRAAKSGIPNIGGPAARALASKKITKIDQLAKHSESELLALHGMGPKALGLLKKALAARGKTFAVKKK